MNKFTSFMDLLVKQTCRRASHEFELESKQSSAPQVVKAVQDDIGIYSKEFLKSLHDNTRDALYKLLKTKDPNNPNSVEAPVGVTWLTNKEKDFSLAERKKLLHFLYKVKDMAPKNAKNWIDLHHFMHYVYRNFASVCPDPTAEYLTPYFLDEMRGLIRNLLQEDESQLYLRVLALLREYCIFAQWNFTKQEGSDHLITKLFYYYEAMLTAAKNLREVFADFEVIVYSNYSVCWIDFNTCVFIQYFLETDYVQRKIKQCLETRVSPGDPPALFDLLEDLQNLWIREENRIKKLNEDHSLVEGTVAYYIEEAMISNHKKVLNTNFWMERTEDEKNDLDLRRLDHHIFRLIGDARFHPAGPILDKNGQCICEECLIAKYDVMINAVEERSENKLLKSTSRLTFCRRCRTLLELESFHRHVTAHERLSRSAEYSALQIIRDDNPEVYNSSEIDRIVSGREQCLDDADHAAADEVKAMIKDIPKVGQSEILCEEPPEVSPKIPMPKELRNTAPFQNKCDIHFSTFEHDPNELTCTRLAFEEFIKQSKEGSKHETLSNKNAMSNFIKIKKDIFSNTGKVVFDDSILNPNTFISLTPSASPTKKKPEPVPKPKEVPKAGRKTERTRMTSIKPPPKPSAYIPYDNLCKHVNETAVCQGHSGMCDHQKEAKKCDCTYCEVFGTNLSSHTHKNSELRDRLRNRLHQRREKRTKDTGKHLPIEANSAKIKTVISKVEERVPLPSSPTNIPPPAPTIRTTYSSGSSCSSGSSASSPSSGSDDIHGIVSYIEGNLALTKLELAQKKAAKKARQRQKKEEDRIKAEEEQKKREEENKIKEAEKKKEMARRQAEKEKAEAAAAQALKELKKKSKKERQAEKKRLLQQQKLEEEERKKIVEETVPAMVTVKRVAESGTTSPTVSITLKGSTPAEGKLLYNLVNGPVVSSNIPSAIPDSNKGSKKKKKQKQPIQRSKAPEEIPQVVTKELKVTVALHNEQQNKEPASTKPGKLPNTKKIIESKKSTKVNDKKQNINEDDSPIPMFRLPPGITITKIDGPVAIRNFQGTNAEEQKNSSVNANKSGVIVVDTEKLIHKKQNNEPNNGKHVGKGSKKNKKKTNVLNKKPQDTKTSTAPTEVKKMVTLKNPIFHSFQQQSSEPSLDKNSESCGPAAIFTNENGMVTIRSSRLQQSLSNGGSAGSVPLTTISNFAPEIQKSPIPSTVFTNSQMQDTKSDTMCPFYAQEILSGLPGIEITKVDKKTVKPEPEEYKSCQTAQVSIIPASTNGGEAFNFDNLDKDDWLFDSVFSPREVLEDNMDPEELELEAFKRFCSQSIPPKRKEKVAHLNVADIVVKKKTNFY